MSNQPLWKVMRHAYDQSSVPSYLLNSTDSQTGDCLTDRYGYAAELRAIADDADAQFDDYAPAHKVIAWLRAEADRAERRGITPPPTEPEYADP